MRRTVALAGLAVFLVASSSGAEVLFVRAETAFLRTQPDLDSDVVSRVVQGTLLDVIEKIESAGKA